MWMGAVRMRVQTADKNITIIIIIIIITPSFCLLKMLTDGLEWCGLLVDYCDVFISCLDSHSDGTHSLQSIHCWDSDAMLHFSKSDEETNSSKLWMAWWCAHVLFCFILFLLCPFFKVVNKYYWSTFYKKIITYVFLLQNFSIQRVTCHFFNYLWFLLAQVSFKVQHIFSVQFCNQRLIRFCFTLTKSFLDSQKLPKCLNFNTNFCFWCKVHDLHYFHCKLL